MTRKSINKRTYHLKKSTKKNIIKNSEQTSQKNTNNTKLQNDAKDYKTIQRITNNTIKHNTTQSKTTSTNQRNTIQNNITKNKKTYNNTAQQQIYKNINETT